MRTELTPRKRTRVPVVKPPEWELPQEFTLVMPTVYIQYEGAAIPFNLGVAAAAGLSLPRPQDRTTRPDLWAPGTWRVETPPNPIAELQPLMTTLKLFPKEEWPRRGATVVANNYYTWLLTFTRQRVDASRDSLFRTLLKIIDMGRGDELVRIAGASPAYWPMGGYKFVASGPNPAFMSENVAYVVVPNVATVTGAKTGSTLYGNNRGTRREGLSTCRPPEYERYATAVREFAARLFFEGEPPWFATDRIFAEWPLVVGERIRNVVRGEKFAGLPYLLARLRSTGFVMGTNAGGWWTVRQTLNGAGHLKFDPKEWEVLPLDEGQEPRPLTKLMRAEPTWKAHFQRTITQRIFG